MQLQPDEWQPKRKAYGLIHDGKRVLMGEGGIKKLKGKDQFRRPGFHFPGGTIEADDGDGDAGALTAFVREIAEEFGDAGATLLMSLQDPVYMPHPNTPNVTFLVYEVSEKVLSAACGAVKNGKGKPWDPPFEVVLASPFAEAIQRFKQLPKVSGWFAEGCEELLKRRGGNN